MAQIIDTTTASPRLHGSGEGYLIGNEWFEGFADRPELPEQDRVLIAQWAARFTPDQLSDEQGQLLAERIATPRFASQALEDVGAAIRDAEEDLPQAVRIGLYSLLSEDELEKVRFPSLTSALEGRNYPLAVNELAKLTGVTPKQIRHWDDVGLLPSHRLENQRRFYSAAAVHAFALRRLDPYQVAVLSLVIRGDQRLSDFLPLLGSALAFTARRITGEAARELTHGAELVARYGGLLAGSPAKTQATASPGGSGRASGGAPAATEPLQHSGQLYLTKGSGKSHVWLLRRNPRGSAIGRFDTQREAKEFVIKQYEGVGSIEIRSGETRRTVRMPSRATSRRPGRARAVRSRGSRRSAKAAGSDA